ncbi:MAG: T9SS type A sorting domain-containing protein, partial [Bacteroidota bacterium]|nr:T9SS type A sorting domain-containing protein [Bacteroidota bacterium]
DNADSSLCQAVVTIPAIDAPKLSPRCHVPDSLVYDAQLDSYVPNPFTVKLTCVNNGQLPATNVLGTLVLPPDMELINPAEPLTKNFNPSTLRPWAIGDPTPELSWQVRYTQRAHAPVCPEFVFLVTGESTKGVSLDTVRVSCCVPVKPVLPQWACALEIPDSLGLNVSGTAVEPNPFTVRYTITNSGQRAGIIRRVRFPLPLQDGVSLLPSSPMGLDDSVDVTIGPNATASFEWLVSVRDRITRRDLQLQVTAWDDAGDPIPCADNLPIAAVRQQLTCGGIDLPKEICAEGATFFVTVTLRNSGSVNINSPEVLLEWTDVNGTPYVAFDPAWPDSMNPKSRGVIFPGQELEFRWFFRTIARNTGSAPVQVHYSVRFGGDGIPAQDGGPNCVGTVTILPSQLHPIDVIGSLTPCEGDTVVLDAGGGYMAYRWSEGGSALGDTLRHLAVTQSGEYLVRRAMTTAPYCAVFSDTVRVTFNPRPATPLITRNGNTLTASAASSWQWLREGNAIPGATAQSYAVTQDGSYSVVVTNTHGCSAMSDTMHVTVLSADVPPDPRLRIAVFPNPARDVFTVSIDGARTQQLSLRVTDMLGREVLHRDIAHEGSRQRLRVDLSGRAAGVYFLHVDGADGRETRLLLLQRE